MKSEKKNTDSLIRLIGYIVKGHGWSLVFVAVLILVSTLCTLAMTLFTRTLIDDYILPLTLSASPDFTPLAVALCKLAAVLIAGTVASYVYNVLMIKVGQKVMLDLRTGLFDHLQSLPIRYFDSHSHGDIMSVFTNDVDTLRQVVGRSLPQLFSSFVTIISTLVSMIVLSVPLTLISLACTALIVFSTMKIGKASRRYFRARQENMAKVNGFIEEMVSGQRVVKVMGHERKAMEDFEKINESLRSSVNNANRTANTVMPVNGNLTNLGYVLIAIIGAMLTIRFGESFLTIGTIVSFLTLHKNFSRPVSHLSQEINSIVMAGAGADRVYALYDEKPETDGGTVSLQRSGSGEWQWKEGTESWPLEGLVALEDVDFGYVPEKTVLHDISLTAYPGQKIAFVGGTGAGKTTITNLINRFYDISEGSIRYDGRDVSSIEKPSLRRSLGVVLQETHLFSGTIMENIRYGRLDATDEECMAAASLVFADSFISHLPDGYNTYIDADADNLSQGERQLLSLARTAVADPPVLILDEATSSIDTRTEKLIQKSMDSIMKGRTTFVIAHRLSTVKNADYIIVLDKGRIVECGKHFELLEQKGQYYRLLNPEK